MKISYNWLKDYLAFNLSPKDLAEVMTGTGLEVESIMPFESVPGGLDGVVIGEVLEKEKHPDADKLSVTKVNVGVGEPLQIVCGAPNVAAGQKVAVALIGTTLYPSKGDKLVMKKAKIRGIESNGMICAEDELGLGESHDGILILHPDATVGMLAAEYFKVEKDHVFEIGLTPNRSDAFSHLGVARDVNAALHISYKVAGLNLKLPSTELPATPHAANKIKVSIDDASACPRYSGISIENITVKESPEWLKNRLRAIGLRPINNVVDVTNYVLHEYGQPLHAFDADKITGNEIIVKQLPEGTPFLTLDGKEIKLTKDDLMICNANAGMSIAGVFGGAESGVSSQTKNIFIESAHFAASTIRKTAVHHNLRTDAAQHFEKGCDPNNTIEPLKRAATLILELCGGAMTSDIIDLYPQQIEPQQLIVSYTNIHRLAGIELSKQTIKDTLTLLGIEILKEDENILQLAVPTFKPEVTREADIVEEILRIYGYNSVPFPKQLKASLSFSPKIDALKMEGIAANYLVGNSFHEISTNSISQSKFEQDEQLKQQQILLLKSQTAELDCLRTSMVYSGLEVISYNQNRKQQNLKLYEVGKTYHKVDGAYQQQQHLTVFLTGKTVEENWLDKGAKQDFYQLKTHVINLLERLGLSSFQKNVVENNLFSFALQLNHEEVTIATIGSVSKAICTAFDVKQEVFYADINWDYVLACSKDHSVTFSELPKFPAVRRDLAMVLDANLAFEQIEKMAFNENKKILQEVALFDVYKGDKIEAGKKSYAVSFVFQDKTKTLTDAEIDKAMSRLMQKFETELNAQIRKQ